MNGFKFSLALALILHLTAFGLLAVILTGKPTKERVLQAKFLISVSGSQPRPSKNKRAAETRGTGPVNNSIPNIEKDDFTFTLNSENPAPEYPEKSRQNGEQGSVILRLELGAVDAVSSRIIATGVEKSSGFKDLDNEAIKAVQTWKFPALPAGQQTLVLLVPFDFTLQH